MSTRSLRRLARAAGALGIDRAAFIEWALGYITRAGGVTRGAGVTRAAETVLGRETAPGRETALDHLAQKLTLPEDWRQLQTVGWLYQFFTSSAKSPRRQGSSVRQSVPRATGLYTPEWITSFLLGHTLDHLLNHLLDNACESAGGIDRLKKITFLDPACGTGHILLAAYDRLEKAYLRLGYPPQNIPRAIFANNLFGLDIDAEAAALARRLLALRAGDTNLSAENILAIGTSAREKEIGSLLVPVQEKPAGQNIFNTREELAGVDPPVLELLARKYSCVVTNPPYLGWKGIPRSVKEYVQKQNYLGRGNLDTLFIERALRFLLPGGRAGLITTQGWMFLPTFRELRRYLLENAALQRLAHLGTGAFDAISGEVVASCAFIFRAGAPPREHRPLFYRLVDCPPAEKEKRLRELTCIPAANIPVKSISAERREEPKIESSPRSPLLFRRRVPELFDRYRQSDFARFPGAGIYYHLSPELIALLCQSSSMGDWFDIRQGMATGDNRRFLRPWYEVSPQSIGRRWLPYAKGEGARRWASGIEYLIDWENDGKEVRASARAVIRNPGYFFREGVSWSYVGTGPIAARFRASGAIFDVGASTLFARFEEKSFTAGINTVRLTGTEALKLALGFLNTPIAAELIGAINPSTNCQVGDIKRLPFPLERIAFRAGEILPAVTRLIEIHQDILSENPRLLRFRSSALRACCLALPPRKRDLTAALECLANRRAKRREEIDALEEKLARLYGEILGVTSPGVNTSINAGARKRAARTEDATSGGSSLWRTAAICDLLAERFGSREATVDALRDFWTELFGKNESEKNLSAAARLLRLGGADSAEEIVLWWNKTGRKRRFT